MQIYQELNNMKEWLESRNWPRTESLAVITASCHEIWNLMNKLENNRHNLLVKSSALPIIDEVLQELDLFSKNTYLDFPFNQNSLSETADKLIHLINLLIATQNKEVKLKM